MTTTDMLEWFNLLQDKSGSVYYTEDEQLLFLNRAQYEYVNGLLPSNEGGIVNVEDTQLNLENIHSLVFEIPLLVMDSAGIIDRSEVIDELQTISGDSAADIMKTIAVEYKRGQDRFECKFMRHNDKGAFEKNYFKKPSFESPKYLLQNNNYQFRPIDELATINITVIKTPKLITDMVDCELPPSTHNEIVAIGLEFAGISSRDEMLAELNRLQLPK